MAEPLAPDVLADEAAREAAFVAAIEAQLAAQRTDPALGTAAAETLMAGVDALVRKRWGPWAWVRRTALGRVQQVNTATRRTRTLVAPAGAGAATVQTVKYGFGTPTVGATYPVQFPVRLPDAPTPLITGPVPAGDPWFKAPGGARWLYAQAVGSDRRMTLYRWTWPPPTDLTVEWPPEIVATGLDRNWFLLGASTPPDESTQIVFERRFIVGAEGDPRVDAISSTLHHLDHMGFGDEVHTYTLAPEYASTGTPNGPGAIANDGVAVAALNIRGQAVPIPDSRIVPEIQYPQVDHQECCIDFPIPDGVFHSCVVIDNHAPLFIYRDEAHPPEHREMGQGLWLGDPVPMEGPANFGRLHRTGSLFESGGVWQETFHATAPRKTCNGSGCHVITGFTITWDTYECVYDSVDSAPLWFWFFEYTSSLHYEYGAFGAWEYDGVPAGAWAWRELAVPRPHMYTRYDALSETYPTMSLKVQGHNCDPIGPITLWTGPADVNAISLDPATRELIVWYRTAPSRVGALTYHRWRKGTDHVFQAAVFYAASRDGTDALIQQTVGRWAYTLDSGETWLPCRAPDITGQLFLNHYKIVDELA